MKIAISKSQWQEIGKQTGWFITSSARRKDSEGLPISYQDKYFLKLKWQYIHDKEAPYFLGGGSFHAPEMVMLPNEAIVFRGFDLLNMAYDWTMKWDAIRKKNV